MATSSIEARMKYKRTRDVRAFDLRHDTPAEMSVNKVQVATEDYGSDQPIVRKPMEEH